MPENPKLILPIICLRFLHNEESWPVPQELEVALNPPALPYPTLTLRCWLQAREGQNSSQTLPGVPFQPVYTVKSSCKWGTQVMFEEGTEGGNDVIGA